MAHYQLNRLRSSRTFIIMKTISKHETDQPDENNVENALHELFLDELADLQSAEQQLIVALPKMIKAAKLQELKSAIEAHLEETKGQAERLEQIAQSLGQKLPKKTCAAMQGLIKEASELIDEQQGKDSLDAAIIAAAQKVEHYEIGSYGTVRAWAERLGHSEAADLLKETLDEESAADDKLTEIAESEANEVAQNGRSH